MLGLAPFAAKEVVKDLSSAYDFRFGNSSPLSSLNGVPEWSLGCPFQGTYLGIKRSDYPGRLSVPSMQDVMALQIEHFRKQIPTLFKVDRTLFSMLHTDQEKAMAAIALYPSFVYHD